MPLHTRLERFGCELFSEAAGDAGMKSTPSLGTTGVLIDPQHKVPLPAVNGLDQLSPYRTKSNYGPRSCIEWLTALQIFLIERQLEDFFGVLVAVPPAFRQNKNARPVDDFANFE